MNRRPDMRTRGATGTPGASLAAGAEQPAGRLASTGREAGTLFASVTDVRWLPPTAANCHTRHQHHRIRIPDERKTQDMPYQRPPRLPSALASMLATAGIELAVASCTGHLTPLGPDQAATMQHPHHLRSPLILQVMRSQPPTATGRCPAGWAAVPVPRGAAPMPCYRPVGRPVTLTSAAVSSVSLLPSGPPSHPARSASYGFMVAVPAADVAAVTAAIRRAYDSQDALGVSVAGKLWAAPQITVPFPGRQLEIGRLSRNQALRLHRILIPSG